MAKKKDDFQKVATVGKSVKEFARSAERSLLKGEELGDEILVLLDEYGTDFEALVTGTYALAKAWSAMQVISNKRGVGVDMKTLFDSLLPAFKMEMESMLKK